MKRGSCVSGKSVKVNSVGSKVDVGVGWWDCAAGI